MTQPITVVVFVTNPQDVYSGGRYCALGIAEALAHRGNTACFVTDTLPAFYDDFAGFPHHGDVKVFLTKDFKRNLPEGPCDVVLIVPNQSRSPGFYLKALTYARRKEAHVALLNFESPNWFNAYAPEPRNERLWDNWLLVSRQASLILSISAEGQKYAEQFYRDVPAEAIFDYVYPVLNTFAADGVEASREKRIVLIMRFGNSRHKGGDLVPKLVTESMRGYTLVLLIGAGAVPDEFMEHLRVAASRHGVAIEIKYRLSDAEKFREIKRSSLVLFPSYFEGFGYPPLEAQYCGVPCLAFDLPVLRERFNEGVHFVPHGDQSAFATEIGRILRFDKETPTATEQVAGLCGVDAVGQRLEALFDEIRVRQRPHAHWASIGIAWLRRIIDSPRELLRRAAKRLSPGLKRWTPDFAVRWVKRALGV